MIRVPATPDTPEIRFGADGKYSLDGGINLLRQETALPMNQASDILNENADDRGTLSSRPGQALLDTSLGAGGCTSIIYKGKIIKQWSTFLYSYNLDGSSPVQIFTGLAVAKSFFIVFQGLLYMFNGTDFIQYDGITVSTVVSNAYVPIISQAGATPGSTVLYEPLNLLTGKFSELRSPDGVNKIFTLSFTGLDAMTVVSNNGTVEGTGFTVNRTALPFATVTFVTAPTAGTNTLKLTASKTNASDVLQILNCTRAIEFSSRLFITGNPNYPNRLWKTGLTPNQATLQANYFPATGLSSFDSVTGIDKKMVAFIKKLDKLVYFKEDSTNITYNQTQADGSSGFPISNVDETIGCDMPGSVQLVNSMPIFFNSLNGGYAITSTTVLGENVIKDISANINGNGKRQGLLQESLADLQNCSSFNDGQKYYLCIPGSGHVYVWDYSLGYNLDNPESLHWFIYDNIHANNFFMVNGILCYSSSVTGSIVKFIDALNDFGSPIVRKWKSKLMDMGMSEYYKNITEIWLTTRANSNSTININYYDDNRTLINTSLVPQSSTKSFSWSAWKWSTFTWKSQKFDPTMRFKPGIRNVRYFQIEITNNVFNEDLSIVTLVIKWVKTRKVK
jgi:hypothetical protein